MRRARQSIMCSAFSSTTPVDKPFQAPPLPHYFVPRREITEGLKARILDDVPIQAGVRSVIVIQGMAGIGKSTLAAYIANDPEIDPAFPTAFFGPRWASSRRCSRNWKPGLEL